MLPCQAVEGIVAGIHAPLSPHEEVTLRRIALATVPAEQLPNAHVRRLQQLNLIETDGTGYRLTPAGRERYNALPRATDWEPDGSVGAVERLLSEIIRSPSR